MRRLQRRDLLGAGSLVLLLAIFLAFWVLRRYPEASSSPDLAGQTAAIVDQVALT